MKKRTLAVSCLLTGLLVQPVSAATARTAEQESAWLGQHLRPISDDDWKNVAGGRASEKYEITKGDTLFDISKRLFGDGRYWPKIWALNNGTITNPHVIKPGNLVAFLSGTGSSLPAIAIATKTGEPIQTATDVKGSSREKGPGVSTDWKNLPRQGWEMVSIALPPEVDPQGFDLSNRVPVSTTAGLDLEAMATTGKLDPLGEITGSRSDGNMLGMGDTIFITPAETLQIGETYAITQPPTPLKSAKTDRTGYSYLLLGRVKIVAVKDNLFVGLITVSRHPISRGAFLIPAPARIKSGKPIPGSHSVEGVLFRDRNLSTYAVAQHKLVFIDRGSQDDVQPGMFFRIYEHSDPATKTKITNSDFIVAADILVLNVSERFCTGLITKSLQPITENSSAILLTDVSDLNKNTGFRERSLDEKPHDGELDDLDKLDTGGGIGNKEKRELKQLEKWKENPAATPPPAEAAPAPAPEAAPEAAPTPAPEAEKALSAPAPAPAPAPTTEPAPSAPAPEVEAPPPPTSDPAELPPPPPPED